MPKSKAPIDNNALACGSYGEDVQLKGRIWLEKNGQTFISWGRVILLEAIDREGSVLAAAKALGMSYSHAWNLVEAMNCMAGQALVRKQTGGQGGGGASLTPAGKKAIADFWKLVKQFRRWIKTRPTH